MADVKYTDRKAAEMAGRKYYLAGPMSSLPQANIPAFDAAAEYLRTYLKLEIVSPAELDDPEVRAAALAGAPTGKTWGEFLGRDVPVVADTVQGIILLDGWEKSRGARLEAYVGVLCGHTHWLYPSLERVSASYIVARL